MMFSDSEWTVTTLGEICKISGGNIQTGPFGSQLHASDYVESGIPSIMPKNISVNGVDETDIARITAEDAKRLEKYRVNTADIIYSRRGDVEKCALITDKEKGWLCGTGCLRIRLGEKSPVSSEFLHAYLSLPESREWIKRHAVGATMPNLNTSILNAVPIKIPPKSVRAKGELLWNSFNQKLNLNKEINQTLEQIAQTIFKSWFVDFEPVKAKIAAREALIAEHQTQSGKAPSPQEIAEAEKQAAIAAIAGAGDIIPTAQLQTLADLFPNQLIENEIGEIPEGWEVTNIDSVCDFQNGYAFKSKEMSKSPTGTYKVFKMGGIKKGGGLNKAATKDYFDKSKCEKLGRYLIKKGDLLMCMTDMKNNVALLGHTALMDVSDEFILNQRVGLLRTKDVEKANYPFLYKLTNSDDFIEDLRSRANSGVQVNLSTKEIKDTNFVLPAKGIHMSYDNIALAIQEKIFSLEAEQETLEHLRDALLPKLLSGEIELEINQRDLMNA